MNRSENLETRTVEAIEGQCSGKRSLFRQAAVPCWRKSITCVRFFGINPRGLVMRVLAAILLTAIGRAQASDGAVDLGFVPSIPYYGIIHTAVLQVDGKVVIGGDLGPPGSGAHCLRLDSSGAVDSAFDPRVNSRVYSAVVRSDGRVWIGGEFSNVQGVLRRGIARLTSGGNLDGTFGPTFDGMVYCLDELPGNRIVIGGSSGYACFNLDGSPSAAYSSAYGVNVGAHVGAVAYLGGAKYYPSG